MLTNAVPLPILKEAISPQTQMKKKSTNQSAVYEFLNRWPTLRKHAYIILTPLNPNFI